MFVRDSVVTLSGRLFITDKANNLYQAKLNSGPDSLSGWWFERWNPDLHWYPATAEPRYSMNRIWFAGNYTVELRQQDSTAARVRRGRLSITVCNPCGDLLLAAPGSTPTPDQSWSLFGGGPWLSWGTDWARDVVRFYDLQGMPDAPSRFTENSWLDSPGGSEDVSGAPWGVEWRPRPLSLPDARAFDFSTTSPGGAVPYAFGLALDPDLGRNAADDRAGYDASRGLVYVYDGERALGYLLRDASGADALASVQQYGLARRGPVTRQEAWAAQRAPGVRLLPGSSDVQLLLSAPVRRDAATWTLVMVRAGDVAGLQARADTALAALTSGR